MIVRTKHSYSRKINSNSNSKDALVYFWIFFLGAIANIGYSIYVFIVEPQPIVYFCVYFGVVYLFISVVALNYYQIEKDKKDKE